MDDSGATKREIIYLIEQFMLHGMSWNSDKPVKISDKTAEMAKAFVTLLPTKASFPKISPSGDDDLTMMWNRGNAGNLLVVIDGERVSAVRFAGTADAVYLDGLPFDGKEIPKELLEWL